MKLDQFSYNVAMKTLELLEKQHNYKVPEDVKKEIVKEVIAQLDSLIE